MLTAVVALLSIAVAWNILGHMPSGSIAFQILRNENTSTIAKVRPTDRLSGRLTCRDAQGSPWELFRD
jgi:hypothetical protein